jgi:chromosome segregation ATPase
MGQTIASLATDNENLRNQATELHARIAALEKENSDAQEQIYRLESSARPTDDQAPTCVTDLETHDDYTQSRINELKDQIMDPDALDVIKDLEDALNDRETKIRKLETQNVKLQIRNIELEEGIEVINSHTSKLSRSIDCQVIILRAHLQRLKDRAFDQPPLNDDTFFFNEAHSGFQHLEISLREMHLEAVKLGGYGRSLIASTLSI